MGRVTRSRYQQLHVMRTPAGRLEETASRWWDAIGSRLEQQDPRIVDAWLDRANGAFLLVVSHRHLEQLRSLAERSREVLGPDLVDLAVSDLASYHDREAFSGEPAHSDPTLPSPHRSPWERIHILEDDRTLRISFMRGVVTYLHHVEVQIDRWAVDVTVYLGYDRDTWKRVERGGSFGYTLVGIGAWTEVVLDEPVGDRYVRGFDTPD